MPATILKRGILLSGVCALVFLACRTQHRDAERISGKNAAALLWKISGNGLEEPSYILGTIHLICRDDFVWTDNMQKALKAARKIAFELDMDDPSLQGKVSAGLLMEDGKTLKDLFTPEEYARLSEFSRDSLGMPLDMLQHMKPLALLSLFSMKSVSCPIPSSYEEYITGIATASHKEIVGLETAEDQLKIFDDINADTAAQQLLDAVRNWDSVKIQYDELLAAYKKQDLSRLYDLIIASPDFKNDLNTLLFNRNQKWIPGIEQLVKSQPTLIAVGAGHLWGDKGVLRLLQEQGYTVEPLP